MKTYTTGKFAKLANVSVRTIRYYDQQGLLKPSFIMENGYRCYNEEDVQKLQKILTLKYLGFSLQEIKTMLLEEDEARMQDLLDTQITLIDQKISHMNSLKESLLAAKSMIHHDSLNWQEFNELIELKEQDEKIMEHYRSANHLAIRIHLHEMFSTNPQGWYAWLLEQIEFQHIDRMLELGCGDGELWKQCTIDLRKREVFLSDISEGMIATARQRLGEEFSYMAFDCQNIPFKHAYFDAVIANHMLFYVNDLDLALSQIERVLKEDGVFYCSTYGANHMREITEIAQEFDPEITLSDHSLSARFGLDHGEEQLSSYFSSVACKRFVDALEITEAKPLMDYIMSCHGNQMERLANRLSEFHAFLDEKLKLHGTIHVSKEAGLFICHKEKA